MLKNRRGFICVECYFLVCSRNVQIHGCNVYVGRGMQRVPVCRQRMSMRRDAAVFPVQGRWVLRPGYQRTGLDVVHLFHFVMYQLLLLLLQHRKSIDRLRSQIYVPLYFSPRNRCCVAMHPRVAIHNRTMRTNIHTMPRSNLLLFRQ